jgi:hypothetical protein
LIQEDGVDFNGNEDLVEYLGRKKRVSEQLIGKSGFWDHRIVNRNEDEEEVQAI